MGRKANKVQGQGKGHTLVGVGVVLVTSPSLNTVLVRIDVDALITIGLFNLAVLECPAIHQRPAIQ